MLFDEDSFQIWLAEYKKAFNSLIPGYDYTWWEGERDKWVAVKNFQDHWDIEAPDFHKMLEESLAKKGHFLDVGQPYSKIMILLFAEKAPEELRQMFHALFDETKEVVTRIEAFKLRSIELTEKLLPPDKGSGQDEKAISTYLWLRYPDKYYLYKISEVAKAANKLKCKLPFKQRCYNQAEYERNLTNFFEFYGELNSKILEDPELRIMLDKDLDEKCYPDPHLNTLTVDFGFFMSRVNKDTEEADEYPRLSVEEWKQLIQDPNVFDTSSLSIMRRMMDMGGSATCKELSVEYGEHWNWYNSKSQSLASRIINATGIDALEREDGSSLLWPVLYKGETAGKDVNGSFVWTLHDNLRAALEEIDLSTAPLYSTSETTESTNHWWLNANPRIWSYSSLPIGEVQSYTLYNENGNKRRIFQNFLDAKPGDTIIGYESNPTKKIIALGRIVEGSDGEKITFTKDETLLNPISYQDLKVMPELAEMEFFVNSNGSLFKLTDDEYQTIMDVIREENPEPKSKESNTYGREDFLSEVYISEENFDKVKVLLERKKNLILQGAPGTGKTFAAKRLAYALMGAADDDRVELVQFHQNYSYEDFVRGYKPADDGFALEDGTFFRFCQKASNMPDKPFIFIIDEINRGNMSKIFGELLMLIESSHRGEEIALSYGGYKFAVPENIFIIGMMNTADRSLAMIDYALRRRFAFFEMSPAFQSAGFAKEIERHNSKELKSLVEKVEELNEEISSDKSLGRGFKIGHSYFCDLEDASKETLLSIVDYEIIPMLEEYWFDDEEKVKSWSNALKAAVE